LPDTCAFVSLTLCTQSLRTQTLHHDVQLILKALEADLRKMMSPNTATNLRVSHEVFLCAVWCAVSAFKTCTHLCVCVAECCCAIIDFCQSRVMTTVFDWRVCHCIKLCFPSMAICHFPPCFNADCCKICTATEQLFFTSCDQVCGLLVSRDLRCYRICRQTANQTYTYHRRRMTHYLKSARMSLAQSVLTTHQGSLSQ